MFFVAEPVKGFDDAVSPVATPEMLDAFRYHDFIMLAFSEKCPILACFWEPRSRRAWRGSSLLAIPRLLRAKVATCCEGGYLREGGYLAEGGYENR